MIIFGTRARHKTLGEGQFFCPRCQAQRSYAHKQATRYFTLYFIPLIPMGKIGEYVECQSCGTAFEMQVLQQPPLRAPRRQSTPTLTQMINTIPMRLEQGEPVEYVVRDLTAAGVDRDAALNMVNPHVSGSTRTCESCGLSYAANVRTCAECNQPL